MFDDDDPRTRWALFRYQVISAYLAMDPPRGERGALRDKLAAKTWTGPDGAPVEVKAETIRAWVRRYRRRGLAGLQDAVRERRGMRVLDDAQVELLCRMKREVPERSLDRLIRVAEGTKLVPEGVLRRSTVHRVLEQAGLSKRPAAKSNTQDLDRFEADRPNDLWQSDLLKGPYLPDPERPGKFRRADLYAFLDDHSRLLLHGRFAFREHLPSLELVFRRALQKYGVPRRLYYDNGQVYRSNHMAQIAATLGIHRIVFTTPYRPEGHGKIEALNRYIRAAFLAELKASRIETLDELNEAFVAWMQREYNEHFHSETQQTPRERYFSDSTHIRYADEEDLRQAFLWKENRTADKAGVFSLLGDRYQVRTVLQKRKVEIRFDPEALDEVEVWQDNAFVERSRPFEVGPHRRPVVSSTPTTVSQTAEPAADWLGHLVQARREEGFVEPKPRADAVRARAERRARDLAVIELLSDRLDDGVVDIEVIQAWLDRFGPLEPQRVAPILGELLERERADHHVHHYLEAIRRRLEEVEHDEDKAT
jgi:transposase InsO family protein